MTKTNTTLTVEETFKLLHRQFDTMDIKQINDLSPTKEDIVSTGIMGLDNALGVGGIKKGSIVEIYGPESAGKTALALHLCKQFQKTGKPVLYIDTERTLTRETVESRGVTSDSFYLIYVKNLEMAFETCITVARSGAFSAVVVDSLAGIAPKAQIDGNVGDSHVGLATKIMSDTLSVLTPLLADSGCTLIITNQLREKIGVMFGNPEKVTGGRALKYYATVRLDIRRTEILSKAGEKVGNHVRVNVAKNKIAPPFKAAEFDIMYDRGISAEGDVLDLAVKKDIITKENCRYLYKRKIIGKCRDEAKQYLADTPNVFNEITEKLKELCATA